MKASDAEAFMLCIPVSIIVKNEVIPGTLTRISLIESHLCHLRILYCVVVKVESIARLNLPQVLFVIL
ncbi:hypothetical protein M0657_003745 [Pyricularia oryzae]|uniref:Uncharacterized protein n=1 Tax=Pyricularia oryzae TaxID=318829 RepID=A0A4P7NJ21_PYROR|nr:hypothetical protein M9X92_005020 [Pyricularia oryzae]KAI7926512.1 hypothetical protein M0657_003745 [Pyricularia oryzae]QBZ62041.1 hypothetical protein PoMZ_10915 [Pyricularia oryzae]